MQIGVPREIKPQEGRVALLPAEVTELAAAGHEVVVESGAGALSGADDGDYQAAGAQIAESGAAVYGACDFIAKVKEILPEEYALLEARHTLLTNLHTALNPELTDRLLEVGLTGFAAEDMHETGSPNCPLAGEVGAFEGLRLCLAPHGGSGRHFMAHYGAPTAKAVVIGLGAVGQGAVRLLTRLGCRVVGLDISKAARFRSEVAFSGAGFNTAPVETLGDHLGDADLIVNCVLWDKTREDHLLTRAMLGSLKKTAVVADISCDEAGAIETSRPTTWADPVYEVDGIRHFCVDNIPGAVSVTASAGYSRALTPWILKIGELGALEACRQDPWISRGLVCHEGQLHHAETAKLQGRQMVL